MKPGLTVLVWSMSAVGHVNACVGTTKPLLDRGHRVIFLVDKSFQGRLKSLGFEEITYTSNEQERMPGEEEANALIDSHIIGPDVTRERQIKNMVDFFINSHNVKNELQDCDRAMASAIEQYQPNLVVLDGIYTPPALYYSGIPWIQINSNAPLALMKDDPNFPPCFTGLSIHSDKSSWPFYRKLLDGFYHSKKINDWIEEMGYKRFPEDLVKPNSQIFNVYATPDEMNFPAIRNRADCINLEVFNPIKVDPSIKLEQLVPRHFYEDDLDGQYSGKIIYFSLGSMCSVDLTLMRRLVKVLSGTNHKYIVSKGPRHLEFELARNMWGERFLPQAKILPLVDLVIMHGGNNTLTETFSLGKPLIVMPLFADQHDNAQRLEETGLGARLSPYHFEDHYLIAVINRLLGDKQLHRKLQTIAERIQKSEAKELLCRRIEHHFGIFE